MKYLKGFKEYLDENYPASIFELVIKFNNYWTLHLHGHTILTARVTEDLTYDVELISEDESVQSLPKTQIKLLYPSEINPIVQKRIKSDPKVKKLNLHPIVTARPRHHIKNKTLYVLMKERQVVFCTLLEGEIIRGLIAEFTRYDLTMHLKGGTPVTILRHAVYDLRDKKGRCYLKSAQEKLRDWKKSEFYMDMEE